MSFLLATATGAGFSMTYELRTYTGYPPEGFGRTKKYLDIVYVSVSLLFLGSILLRI